jgi:hypothetical protein
MKERQFYIQHGYVGNAMCWWRKGDRGYSTNLSEAGKYPESVARRQAACRPEEDTAWPVDYINGNKKAHKKVVDSQYCDFSEMIYVAKKEKKLCKADYDMSTSRD